MSENNQTTTQEQTTQQVPARKSNSIVYWVIIAILLAGCVYLFMSKNQMAEENALAASQQKTHYDSLSTEHTTLNTEYDAAKAKIDQLFSQNTKLDSALQGKQEEINKMKGRIAAILSNKKASAAELAQAREMIASLTDKTKEYESRIAELEKENTVLTNKNIVLKKEVDSTTTQNISLKKLGSVLHASNIRLAPIDLRRNGKEKVTKKAKKTDVLRITFDIDENRIAEAGNKQVYLRIIGPSANILSSTSNGSGMMNTSKGDQISYSMVKTVSLQTNQPYKNVSADWNQDGDYAKGTYTIEVYNDGYKVGQGNVMMK
jgi:hypothetical protein